MNSLNTRQSSAIIAVIPHRYTLVCATDRPKISVLSENRSNSTCMPFEPPMSILKILPINTHENRITNMSIRFFVFFRLGVGSSAYFALAAKNSITNATLKTAEPPISAISSASNISSPIGQPLFLMLTSDARQAETNIPAPSPPPKAISPPLKKSTIITAHAA